MTREDLEIAILDTIEALARMEEQKKRWMEEWRTEYKRTQEDLKRFCKLLRQMQEGEGRE